MQPRKISGIVITRALSISWIVSIAALILYAVSMLLLVIAILWTGISVVEQIQTYHKSYNQLSKLKRDFRALQIEHQRMMIEQQTFSGTPQVTNRAATELNMFYPDFF